MKITITVPDGIYERLERDRGSIPRSTYIQGLITGNSLSKKMDEVLGILRATVPSVPSFGSFVVPDKVTDYDPLEGIKEFCGRDFDQQFDMEDMKELEAEAYELAKEAGVKVNLKQRYFWENRDGQVVKLGSWGN